MAANEAAGTAENQAFDVECIVNRWLVDFYVFLALDAFKKNNYPEFCGVRDVLDSLLSRPLESTKALPAKLRVLQFLSRINDGDKLDYSFDSDETVTPLESAIEVLGNMRQDCSIVQKDMEKICTSIKEMLVVICLKNGEFEKAKNVLNKDFPKGMVGKKAIFLGLANKKSKTHEVLEQTTFKKFKAEMVQFCESLYPPSVPFLHKAAKQLMLKRLFEREENAAEPHPKEAVPSSSSKENTVQLVQGDVIQKKRLEAVYKALSNSSCRTPFSGLEEEVARDQTETNNDLCLRISISPSPDPDGAEPPEDRLSCTDAVSPSRADPLAKAASPQRRRPYTVAQLVVGPDSQLQASTPGSAASEEQLEEEQLEDEKVGEAGAAEPARSSAASSGDEAGSLRTENTFNSPTTRGTPPNRRARSRNSSATFSEDTEDLLHIMAVRTPVRKPRKRLASSSPSNNTVDDECIQDSSLDATPDLWESPSPHCSHTPQSDSALDKKGPGKWKQLYNNAKEIKETWAEEDMLFTPEKRTENSKTSIAALKKYWSEKETKMLETAVAKFGEGNWSKMLAYYPFEDRTNVNLKDRWRTMKRLKMI